MVEPSRRLRASLCLALGVGCAGLLGGCAVVPRSRLDECHKLSRALEAEKSRLKDSLLSLRSEHDDLAQRADDDARRLEAQDEEIRRLLASVHLYQEEREQLAASVDRLKDQIQVAVNPPSTALLEKLETFARGRPGCEFDPRTSVLTLASDPLFRPGTAQLDPDARGLLGSLAAVLADPDARDLKLLVAGHTANSPVRRTGGGSEPARGHLSLDRATRIRDVIASEAGVDPSRIAVAGFEATRPRDSGPDDAALARNRRIEIHLRGVAAAGPGTAAGASAP